LNPKQFLEVTGPLPEALYLLSGQGEILALNSAASDMLELKSKAIVGQNLSDWVTDQNDKVQRYLQNCRRSGSLIIGSLQWRKENGETIDCRCGGAFLPPSPEYPAPLVLLRSIPRDNSESKFSLLNNELEALRKAHLNVMNQKEQLEGIVDERTQQLKHYAENLKKINSELDQFAYVASHDLKAPLRAIANLSKWIEEDISDVLTPDARKQMDLLRGRVRRMEALIEGILEYSRIGRVTVESSNLDVAELLEETVETLAPPEGFKVNIGPGMPSLRTSRVQLSQVFANLIGNAIKYRSHDNGCVEIAVNDEGDYFQFSVTDDGPGIPEAFHGKVFQIFQTLQARDTLESTGVGLALVKKIVEGQGGNVTLCSSKGEGATFRFTWPKRLPNDDAR
jgi:signal transduction histidine kinase